jgi:hypothetical protein
MLHPEAEPNRSPVHVTALVSRFPRIDGILTLDGRTHKVSQSDLALRPQENIPTGYR